MDEAFSFVHADFDAMIKLSSRTILTILRNTSRVANARIGERILLCSTFLALSQIETPFELDTLGT